MPRRLSEDARKVVLTWAAEEAHRRGDRRLGTDHLLLGLLREPGSPAASALGASLAEAREASDRLDLAALAAVGVGVRSLGEGAVTIRVRGLPPLTSGARTTMKRAVEGARRSRSRRIDRSHLLLAILALRRPDPAAELLHALGIDPVAVRDRLGGSPGRAG